MPSEPRATGLPGFRAGRGHREGVGPPFSAPTPRPLSSRAVSGVDADPDLVHIEAQDLGGGKWGGVPAPGVTPQLWATGVPWLGSSTGRAPPTSPWEDMACLQVQVQPGVDGRHGAPLQWKRL